MRRIGTLDLSRNNLTAIETQMFQDFQYCEHINVAENQITTVKQNGFKDLYFVKINISHNLLATFENESFVNTVNITVLDMSYNRITEIQKQAFPGERSSYMTEWRLEFNNISDLSKLPFHFHGLKILNVSYNPLKRIPRNTFPKLYELHTIDGRYCQIEEIGRAVFANLFSLRNIYLSHNNLTKLFGGIFGSLPTLLMLDLSHNRIESISNGMFADLNSIRDLILNDNNINAIFRLPQSLNSLNLRNNNISYIKPHSTWPTMNALLYLYLGNNSLGDSIGSGTFQHLNSLRNLDLSNNSIPEPPWQALSEMQTLQYLNMEHNNVTTLSRSAFGRLPTIFDINLSFNGVTNVSKQAFEGLLQLITLNMSHNNLHHIPNDAFRGLVSLRNIDLSYNYLKKIDNNTHGLFDDLLSVKNINISHNVFEIVSKKMFPYHKYIPYNVENVDLSFNTIPVLHKNLLVGLQKVKKLNISHNILNEIRPGVLGNLTKLEVIDLSYNDLDALSVGVFGRGLSLREIYLQNNRFVSIPAEVIVSNVNISVVDLRDNQLTEYYPEFVWKAVNGTVIRYNGNPLDCTCVLRPLKSWLSKFLNMTDFDDVLCKTPISLANRTLPNISETELKCSDRRDFDDPNFQVTPDAKFRYLKPGANKMVRPLKMSWYVTTREDVAGFPVTLTNATNGVTLLKESLPYTVRERIYPGIPAGEYHFCVGAETSLGELRNIKPAQCSRISLSSVGSQRTSSLLILISIYLSLYISHLNPLSFFYAYLVKLFQHLLGDTSLSV
ncbi:Insulin-like growth factor-binding protein complex acid labile subunit [Armadillidium vulgare]|nr:Insulin-like growth factor-binding protein complex acid labile subunit [Armadillidium vulgare]